MFHNAKTWQINVAIFTIISGGVLLGLSFGQVNGAAAIFFPAAGMSAAFYYIFRKRIVIGLFGGIFLTNLIYRIIVIDESFFNSLTLALLFLLSNIAGVLVFSVVLTKLKYKMEFGFTTMQSSKFILTVVLSSLASALIGLIAILLLFDQVDIIRTFFYWMIGDATGIIVFAGLIMNHNYHDESMFAKRSNISKGIYQSGIPNYSNRSKLQVPSLADIY